MDNHPHDFLHRPPEIERIREMVRSTRPSKIKAMPYTVPIDDHQEPFVIMQAASWLQHNEKVPEARRLFDSFWFEGELCILFADTNVGKSILAVQIGDSLSKGSSIPGFEMKAKPSTVLYFDFELTSAQFTQRYTDGVYGSYRFDPKFLRAVMNPNCTKRRKFKTYEEFIINAIENALINSQAKILIIDNLTCLRHGTQASAGAELLMHNLQALKLTYNLSILVLAHTPKRNPAKPVTRNDLQGSKMLINFCDSAFAIGESQSQPGLRYLKQIKQRNTGEVWGAGKVCLCKIAKPVNFLQFEHAGNGPEHDHLLHYTEQYRKTQEEQIVKLHEQGKSLRQIADQLHIANSTVHRTLKRLI